MALGVAHVHPVQLGGEQGGLVAAGAGPDLEDDVAVVVRVARQEQDLELLDQARLVGLEAVDLLAGHRLELLVALGGVAHLARAGQFGPGRLEAPERLDDRLELGQLLAEPADLGRVREDLGAAQLRLDRVVPRGDLGELVVEVAHAASVVGPSAIGARSNSGRPLRDRLAVRLERGLHRDDRDLDHVVGRLLRRDLLDEQARVQQHVDDRVLAVPGARA